MPTETKVFKQFNFNNYFVETGSYMGDGIQMAIDAGYKNVISIDVGEQFYNNCKERFASDKFVKLVLGDSATKLGEVISKIKEPITFWLDGHYSGFDLPKGKDLCPLMDELEAIKNHTIKTHTIIIDDMWCWKEMDNHLHEGFDLEMIIKKIFEINPDYTISYVDGLYESGEIPKNDILIATIKTNNYDTSRV